VRDRLVTAYGTRWRDVWALGTLRPALRDRLDDSHPVIAAEMAWGVTREMAVTLGDLLIRRTHLAFESADQARSIAPAVASIVEPLLGWSPADRDAALRNYDEEVRAMFIERIAD